MKKNKLTWMDVTLHQFNLLQEAIKIEDETERVIRIAEILLGDEVTNLPLKEFNEKVKELSFMKNELPVKNPPKKLEVNGRKYYMDCLLGNLSTAQYVDFRNHSNATNPDMAKMLSVFIIPEGHKYNDGYDMLEVINDINDLPIPVVNYATFFFGRQLNKFIEIFQSSLIRKLKKAKMDKQTEQNLIEAVHRVMGLMDSEYFRS